MMAQWLCHNDKSVLPSMGDHCEFKLNHSLDQRKVLKITERLMKSGQ